MPATRHDRVRRWLVTPAVAAALLTGCGGEQRAGPETRATVRAIVMDSIADVEDEITDLEQRIIDLEDFTGEGVDVFAGPDQYMGEVVTVSGEVAEVIDDNAFTVAAPGTSDVLFVIRRGGVEPTLEEGALVRVEGTVREGFSEDVARDFEIERPMRQLTELEGREYIVADDVTVPGGGG